MQPFQGVPLLAGEQSNAKTTVKKATIWRLNEGVPLLSVNVPLISFSLFTPFKKHKPPTRPTIK
jgi:hypothetical protein